MILLLIIADDFTGALDTGVQFALRGIQTKVVVDPEVDFTSCDAKVLVVDTETRHLPSVQAYEIVSKLTTRALQAGVQSIYKKTDSALRGNIGAAGCCFRCQRQKTASISSGISPDKTGNTKRHPLH